MGLPFPYLQSNSLCILLLDYWRISLISTNISVAVLNALNIYCLSSSVITSKTVSLAQEHNRRDQCTVMLLNCFLKMKVADVCTGDVMTEVGQRYWQNKCWKSRGLSNYCICLEHVCLWACHAKELYMWPNQPSDVLLKKREIPNRKKKKTFEWPLKRSLLLWQMY